MQVKEIKKIFELLISKLNEHQSGEINLTVDYYWDINSDELYNPYKQPTELTIGQISEDWESLKHLLEDDREPIAYDYKLLSNILKAISKANEGVF